ncbi:MAG TPA: ABC transporter ATP-binding protein [Tissierellia bacterium]|nr:ABC transporter ATP-binding protein [Tissierellia bacterium]
MATSKNYRLEKLLGYAKRTQTILLGGLLMALLTVVADLFAPRIIARILDHELIEGIGTRDYDVFIQLVVLYGGLIALSALTRFLSLIFFQRGAHKVSRYMQEDLFRHVQTLPIQYFDSLPAGKVVSRVTNDTKDVIILFQVVLSNLSTAALYLIGIYGSLLLLDPKLALIAAIPLPIIGWVIMDYRKKSTELNTVYRSNLSELNASLNENIQGMEIIQAFTQEESTYQSFSQINDTIYGAQLGMTKLMSYSSFNAIGFLRYFTIGTILLYFGYGHITGAYPVSVGILYVFISYMMKIYDQSQNVLDRIGQLQRANVASDHIFSLLQQPGLSQESHQPIEVKGDVTFEHLSFYYKDGEYVLKDVSFTVEQGKTAAFVGHTGSGKSTIMNLLLRFYEAQHGQILIDGRPITELPRRRFREHVAIVLQDPYLFTGTILSNVTLGNPDITEDMAYQAFIDVGGREFLDRHPQGLHTPITEKGATFSAGERQLISFARALAKNPKILVLDEATANIDSETEQLIQRGVERLKKGRTTLLIAHRLSTIREADQIFVLDKGRIVEAGDHEELIRLDGEYKQMYLHQSNQTNGNGKTDRQ